MFVSGRGLVSFADVASSYAATTSTRSQMIVHVNLARGVTVVDGFAAGPAPPTNHPRGEPAAILQRLLEGDAELAIEVGVDERIEGGIEVSDPEDERHHFRRTVAIVASA